MLLIRLNSTTVVTFECIKYIFTYLTIKHVIRLDNFNAIKNVL